MQDESYGLCECGCGQPTKIARQTDPSRGTVRGQPRRFCVGHAGRGKGIPWRTRLVERDTGYVTLCREWTGRLDSGYGRVRYKGEMKGVHVVAWIEANGPGARGL